MTQTLFPQTESLHRQQHTEICEVIILLYILLSTIYTSDTAPVLLAGILSNSRSCSEIGVFWSNLQKPQFLKASNAIYLFDIFVGTLAFQKHV